MLDPRRQDFEHAPGSGPDVEQVARLGSGDDVDERRLDFALVDIERADAMPARGVFAEIGAGEIGALPLDRAQALEIEHDRRIGLAAGRDQMPGEGVGRTRLAQAIEDPAALAETVEQPGLAQQLQVTRYARLALPEDLGQLADGQFAAGTQHEEPQPGRLGHRAQCSHQMFHRSEPFPAGIYQDMFISARDF